MEIAFELLVIIFLLGFLVLYIYTFRTAPFVPTNEKILREMIELLNPRPGERIADPGSGDGRLVLALGQAGAKADGFEINPVLVLWSRLKLRRAGLHHSCHIYWRNIFKVDYSKYDGLVIYLFPQLMAQLLPKLERELPQGARVVSHAFSFPNRRPQRRKNKALLYVF